MLYVGPSERCCSFVDVFAVALLLQSFDIFSALVDVAQRVHELLADLLLADVFICKIYKNMKIINNVSKKSVENSTIYLKIF